jgi:hypothetical protein
MQIDKEMTMDSAKQALTVEGEPAFLKMAAAVPKPKPAFSADDPR